MPPRKRAEPKPPAPETLAADRQGNDTPPTETVPPASTDPGDTTPTAVEPPADEPVAPDDEPTKSDLQEVEQPCPTCFPNGWADGAFSHGCEHGTWIRDNT